jgi:hypothetical protein
MNRPNKLQDYIIGAGYLGNLFGNYRPIELQGETLEEVLLVSRRRNTGLGLGFAFCISLLGTAFWFANNGNAAVCVLLCAMCKAFVVSIFVLGQRVREERSKE